jgi:CubicO group peptidase (beta-lactamase class C family)
VRLDSPFVKRLGWTLFWLLMLHFVVEISGHHYLYNTLGSTIFKGKLGPDIQEYQEMPNRVIEAGKPQPWPLASDYGSHSLNQEELAYHEMNQSVSFVVIHRDELVHEQYWEDFNDTSKSNSFSMAKSIVGLLTGIAIGRGEIESVETPVYYYLPQYEKGFGKEMTVEHLLTMSSGINFDEHYLNPFAYPARANYGDDLEALHINYEVSEKPGGPFNYQSGTTQVLAFTLRAATRRPLADYATEHVWKRIGAEHPAFWSLDREGGMEKGFCCINATAKDFARIGKLYLHYGNWEGTQIVDSQYVAASVNLTGSQTKLNSDIYGYSWWLGEHQGKDFFFMRGIKGQYVLVVPEDELIVVRLGRKRHNGDTSPHPEDVYRYLDMGYRMIEQR